MDINCIAMICGVRINYFAKICVALPHICGVRIEYFAITFGARKIDNFAEIFIGYFVPCHLFVVRDQGGQLKAQLCD